MDSYDLKILLRIRKQKLKGADVLILSAVFQISECKFCNSTWWVKTLKLVTSLAFVKRGTYAIYLMGLYSELVYEMTQRKE